MIYQGAINSLRSAYSDDVSKAENYLRTAYEESKTGKKVTNASTTPYGCAVKYK